MAGGITGDIKGDVTSGITGDIFSSRNIVLIMSEGIQIKDRHRVIR